jgi:hypothetical protein
MTKRLFLIDTNAFTGHAISSVTNGYVDFSGYLHNNGGQNLTLQEYTALKTAEAIKAGKPAPAFSALTWEEFAPLADAHDRQKFLTPARQITPERFDEMLNVMPPENWKRETGFQHFRMMEYTSGDYTEQFAKRGDFCIQKMIKVSDRSTWISLQDFITLQTVPEGGNEAAGAGSKCYVLDGHTLGYVQAHCPDYFHVLQGSVSRGSPHDWKNGGFHILPIHKLVPATREDFADFNVSHKGHIA